MVLLGACGDQVAEYERIEGQESANVQDGDDADWPSSGVQSPRVSYGEDVLPEALEMNSPPYAQVPGDFKPGHVYHSELPYGPVERTKRGFNVRVGYGLIPTPAVHDGKVFVAGGMGSTQFFAFREGTGEFEWGVRLGDDGPSTPACVGEVCVINTHSCTVYALATDTGEMLWSWWVSPVLPTTPTIAAGSVYVVYAKALAGAHPLASYAFASFDLYRGDVKWQRWIDGDTVSAPVADERSVYVQTTRGTTYQVDQESGEIRAAQRADIDTTYWAATAGSEKFTMQPFTMGTHEIGCVSGQLVAVHHRTGKRLWSRAAPANTMFGGDARKCAPTIATMETLLVVENSQILELDPATGKRIDSYTVGATVATQPAVHAGMIYVGTTDGQLVAIDTGKPHITGWEQFGGDAARSNAY
jgi:outer membrane protein assembly factor BamB